MSIDDRFKGRPKPPEKDRFATLKAWVYWAMKNPLDDDQELMAKDVNDLFALLGTREAELEKLKTSRDAALEELVGALEKVRDVLEENGTPSNAEEMELLREALAKYGKVK